MPAPAPVPTMATSQAIGLGQRAMATAQDFPAAFEAGLDGIGQGAHVALSSASDRSRSRVADGLPGAGVGEVGRIREVAQARGRPAAAAPATKSAGPAAWPATRRRRLAANRCAALPGPAFRARWPAASPVRRSRPATPAASRRSCRPGAADGPGLPVTCAAASAGSRSAEHAARDGGENLATARSTVGRPAARAATGPACHRPAPAGSLRRHPRTSKSASLHDPQCCIIVRSCPRGSRLGTAR